MAWTAGNTRIRLGELACGDGLRAAATKMLVAMGGTGDGRTGRGGEGEGRGVAFAAGLQTEGDETRGYVLKRRSVRGQEKERLRRCKCDWMTVRAYVCVCVCVCGWKYVGGCLQKAMQVCTLRYGLAAEMRVSGSLSEERYGEREQCGWLQRESMRLRRRGDVGCDGRGGDLFVWWWWMCELEVDGLDWSGEQKLEVNRRVGGQCAAAARQRNFTEWGPTGALTSQNTATRYSNGGPSLGPGGECPIIA